MDYLQVFALGAAGMGVQRARIEAAAANLAHAQTAQEPGRPAFQPLRALVRPALAFDRLLDPGDQPVPVPGVRLVPVAAAARLVHEPAHPLADARGFVAYPGIDPAAEMMNLMTAMRAYEANLAVLSTARTLALRTLEIGRGA